MKHLMKSVMSLMLGLICFASCSEDTPEKESYFTVSFNSMGGSEVEAQSVKAGEYAVKPENPTRRVWLSPDGTRARNMKANGILPVMR